MPLLGDYFYSSFFARLSAAPRMSPRLAPESDEPKSAIAFFSSSSFAVTAANRSA